MLLKIKFRPVQPSPCVTDRSILERPNIIPELSKSSRARYMMGRFKKIKKRSMGALNTDDLKFLAENTQFQKDTILEWYEVIKETCI